MIGSKHDPVTTAGNITFPTTFTWEKGRRAKYYIRNSGGQKSRTEQTTIRLSNGRSKKVGLFKNPRVFPGASIVAIAKPEKEASSSDKTFMDDFIRIFSVITGALTTAILATKL